MSGAVRYTPLAPEAATALEPGRQYRAYVVWRGDVSKGVVWSESTLDATGRPIATWWWARRAGARVKVLRSSPTRDGAARML